MAEIKGGLGFADPSKLNQYGAKEEDISEYQQSLQDSLAALQMRYAQPNWFNVAAGFFKPQLGGFAASLGSASQAMGENLEKQRESQLPIAQMRSQLAMSKIAMGQNKQAADLVKAHEAAGSPLHELPQLVPKLKALGSPLADSAQSQMDQIRKSQELAVQASQASIAQRNAAEALIDRDERNYVITPLDAAMKRAALPPIIPMPPDPFAPPARVEKGAPAPASAKESAAAAPPPAAAAVETGAPPSVAAAEKTPESAAGATAKTINAQDFLGKAIYSSESPTGAANPLSTAVGKGQMLKGTREFIKEKYGMQAGVDQYDKDPAVAAAYDYALLGHNQGLLKDPTALNHRLMWWFGTGDGPKILNAKNNETLKSLGLSLKENEDPKKDQYKINGLTADTTVGDLKETVSSQLKKNKIDPNAMVAFGDQAAAAAPAAAVAAPAAAVASPQAKVTEQTVFPVLHPRPTESDLIAKRPDERALIIKSAQEKADADELRAKGLLQQWVGYGNPAIYNPYKGELNQSISMIEANRKVADRVFNAMGQGDLQAQLLKAANAGLTFNGGVWSGSINLPADDWVRAGLSKEDATFANKLATNFLHINAYKSQLQNIGTGNPPVAEFNALQNRGANLGQTYDAALTTLKKDRINAYWGNKLYSTVVSEKDKAAKNEMAPTAAVLKHSKEYDAIQRQWAEDLKSIR